MTMYGSTTRVVSNIGSIGPSTTNQMAPSRDEDGDKEVDVNVFASSTSAIVSPPAKSGRPSNFGLFHSVKLYVVCQGLIQLSYLILGSYLKSVITSIEKRFELDSKTAGFMSSGFEIGNLIVILPVSYFGRRIHRPRAIAVGVWFMIVGGILLATPHWIYGPYQPHDGGGNINRTDFHLCHSNESSSMTTKIYDSTVTIAESSQSGIWRLMFFARVLVGIGAAPVQPYGISYMDDHASRAMAPLYLGVLLAISMVGPALGYILGSATTRLYVDFDRSSSHPSLTDAGWIGAWWLGFLLASAVMFLLHIPFWFFPKVMRKEEEPVSSVGGAKVELTAQQVDDRVSDEKQDKLLASKNNNNNNDLNQETTLTVGMDTKKRLETGASSFLFYLNDFLSASLRLIRNPVFFFVILAYATLFAISAGFAIFLPKYFQAQFGVSASTANFYIGSVQMPFGILGVVLGGAVMRRWNMSLIRATAMSVVFSLLTLVVGVPLIFMGCETRPISGVNVDVTNASCLRNCECSSILYDPVCHFETGVEYVSPCNAGCTGVKLNERFSPQEYEDCECLPRNSSSSSSHHAVIPGRCPSLCGETFWSAMVLNCALLFICSLVQSPLYTVLLRSVPPTDKSFAIGLQFLLMRTLGWMPAPVYFGATIDSACLMWAGPIGAKGACKVYDNVTFRQRYLGLITGLQAFGTLLMIVLFVVLLKRPKNV